MKSFLIGFWGKFDVEKYKRDFRKAFYGVEVCMFPNIEELNMLVKKSKEDNFNWGCHYPLIKNNNTTRDPLFLSLDEDERNNAFNDFKTEAELVSQFGGKYILTHFPKPVMIGSAFDITKWRFANEKEWIHEKDYPVAILKQNLYDMFFKLDNISKQNKLQIVLENDAISSYLFQSSILEELLKEFPSIKLCLDIGRLHLQQQVDIEFNGIEFTKKFAPYAFNIHLWNTNPVDNLIGGHQPVSPDQKSEDGFADIRKYLEIIFNQNKDVKILFEHKSDILTVEELDNCYKWVDSIQNNF